MLRHLAISLAVLGVGPGPATASGDTIGALAIGTVPEGAGPDSTVFSDAFHASDNLSAAFGTPVTLLRDADADTVMRGIATLEGADRALIYYTGPLNDIGTGIEAIGADGDPRLEFVALARQAAELGAGHLLLLVENCDGGAETATPLPDADGSALPVTIAASAAPGAVCTDGARLTDALRSLRGMEPKPRDLAEILAPFWQGAATPDPIDIFTPRADQDGPAAADAVTLIDTGPVTRGSSDGAVLFETAGPVTDNIAFIDDLPEVAPVVALPEDVGEGVILFAAPPQAQIAAMPVAAGLPQPSIIIGLIEDEAAIEASLGGEDLETTDLVPSTDIAYDDLGGRRQLRSENPELFEDLIAAGAFDPPAELLVVALQTELQRMRCYTAGIDGDWGRGSRASVQRYFDQVSGASAAGLDPTVGLFRQILRRDDVECPVVARAAPAPTPRATTRATPKPTRSAPARQAAPKRTAPAPARRAAPAPAPAPARKKPSLGTGLGVFR